MKDRLYSRREWLALMAATPFALSLTACAPTLKQAEEYGDRLSEYEGKALDPVSKAKIQGIKGVQKIEPTEYHFIVSGKVGKELSLSYDQVLELPSTRRLVTLPCVEGWSVDHLWDGVRISELLGRADFDPLAATLIFHCADGYSTALPLKTVLEEDVLLAWAVNDITIPQEYGFPFRAVAQHRLGYKWAKWIEGIEVSDDAGYRGYWEQRGYDNDAATTR
jgi:DMSO/TMAO reductase YedYZ molybdopterin-dependent catalytic subunit